MNYSEFLMHIDELLEQPAGTVRGDTRLRAIDGWDSLAIMSFMAMVDEQCQCRLKPVEIAKCETIDHLYALVAVCQ